MDTRLWLQLEKEDNTEMLEHDIRAFMESEMCTCEPDRPWDIRVLIDRTVDALGCGYLLDTDKGYEFVEGLACEWFDLG